MLLSHSFCYLLLLVIDASSTCVLAGQSDMVMKTYAPVMKRLIALQKNKQPCGTYSLENTHSKQTYVLSSQVSYKKDETELLDHNISDRGLLFYQLFTNLIKISQGNAFKMSVISAQTKKTCIKLTMIIQLFFILDFFDSFISSHTSAITFQPKTTQIRLKF